MAEEEVIEDGEEVTVRSARRHPARRALIWIGRLLVLLLALIALTVLFLHTGSGRQYIVDRIARVAPASGLSVSVGRIEGSVLWNASLFDVEFRDANGTLFLQVPEVELNWRPYKFLFSGLDVRSLVLHDGTLFAVPELNPGDPDAPILPDFDIRVDRFVIDDLRVVEGLIDGERVVDFRAEADIRDGLVYLDADGDLGGGDHLEALVNVEPDGDRFDIDFDVRAPEGGLLATLAGADEDMRLRLLGAGTWERWDGAFVARSGGERIAALKVYNRTGRYRISGLVWHRDFVTGLPAQALGDVAAVAAIGTLEDSVLDGTLALRGRGMNLDGEGAVDLADNAFDGVQLQLELVDSELFGPGLTMRDALVRATFDGPFGGFAAPFELTVGEADFGGTVFTGIAERGTLTYDGTRWTMPLNASVQRIVSGNALIDPRLVDGRLTGTVTLADEDLRSDNLALRFPGMRADLTLRGDINRGAYALAGPVEMRGLALENLGTIDAGARIRFAIADGVPWRLAANFTGRMPSVTNATLANLAGENIRFGGGVTLGADRPIVFNRTSITASKLTLLLDGRVESGGTTLAGAGRHVDYGPFTVEAALTGEGPRAVLVFADPLPAAGLRDVRVALAPTEDGFSIETSGGSMLGPFDGLLHLYAPEDGPTRIAIDRLEISRTNVTGELVLGEGAASGTLLLAGGGLDGTIALAPRGGGQGFVLDLTADDARFGGDTPLAIGRADIDVSGFFAEGSSTIQGTVRAQGISYGTMFIGRLAADADVTDGRGTFNASLAGRRGSRFQLQMTGDVAPERIAVAARGSYGGRPISMPRHAVLLRQDDGSWQLQRTQLNFAGGIAIAEGNFGGEGGPQGRLSLSGMPLSLLDVVVSDLGLGGTISGVVDFQAGPGGVPTGEARVMVDNLTRSGLLLSSRPVDLALVARLSPTLVQARAVIEEDGQTRGRFQGRIANLPQDGSLYDRLSAGDLFAQLRYDGPADALWRLAALDMIDITGTLRVAADVTGSLTTPQVRGSLAGDSLRVQSTLTGTDVRQVRARGRFSGSRLQLTSFAGTAPNGGSVSGSGIVDLADMGPGRGPGIDLRIAARDAEILDMATMGATVTGPLRIVSDGVGGTIAGRLAVNEARWRLGVAGEAEELPDIATREINLPADVAPPAAPGAPWRYLIDAVARDGIEVDGMGLDSEWSADIALRGTTSDPRIGGTARIVPRQGFYSFAGARFEITRGIIDFDEAGPLDPQIDLVAETESESGDITVQVQVSGSATRPEITFSSTPSLPEEEILAQLLFGGSISDLSATDALQLGAALASLRGGGGMDPINRLRSAIGLDRLRIVAADPALDRGTALALGKRFGRRFYAEVITDGRGYTATEVEFRITSWLSLLATISSLGRESVALEYSRDY
jgi:translocation and assembly module TamB